MACTINDSVVNNKSGPNVVNGMIDRNLVSCSEGCACFDLFSVNVRDKHVITMKQYISYCNQNNDSTEFIYWSGLKNRDFV